MMEQPSWEGGVRNITMMEQQSWEGGVREGVACPWSVGVETDTGVVDTEGHDPLVGLTLREL